MVAKKTASKPAPAAKKPAAKTGVKAKPAKKAAPVKAASAKPAQADKKPVAKDVKPAASAKPAEKKPALKEKQKKAKLVRDSFTMPEAEYQVLGDLKKACIKSGFEVKKSELLRIGVKLLRETDVTRLKGILSTLPALKAGRPKK